MRVLVIAIGNRLRRDDGVAHAALGRIVSISDIDARALLQLTPEAAFEIVGYDTVVFMDADPEAADVRIEAISERASPPMLTHVVTPGEVVGLARALLGFSGRALLCRIPAEDFSAGEGLSLRGNEFASKAASEMRMLLG